MASYYDQYNDDLDVARKGDNLDKWVELRNYMYNPTKREVLGHKLGYWCKYSMDTLNMSTNHDTFSVY